MTAQEDKSKAPAIAGAAAAAVPLSAALTSYIDGSVNMARVNKAPEKRLVHNKIKPGDLILTGELYKKKKSRVVHSKDTPLVSRSAELASGGSLRHGVVPVFPKHTNKPSFTHAGMNMAVTGRDNPLADEHLLPGRGLARKAVRAHLAATGRMKSKDFDKNVKKIEDNLKRYKSGKIKKSYIETRSIKEGRGMTPAILLKPRVPLNRKEISKWKSFGRNTGESFYDIGGAVRAGIKSSFLPRLRKRGGYASHNPSTDQYHCGSLGASAAACVGRGPTKNPRTALPSDLLMNRDYKIDRVQNKKLVIRDMQRGLRKRISANLFASAVAGAGVYGAAKGIQNMMPNKEQQKTGAFEAYFSKFIQPAYIKNMVSKGVDVRAGKCISSHGVGAGRQSNINKEAEIDLLTPINLAAGTGLMYLAGSPSKNIQKIKDSKDALMKARGGIRGALGLGGTALGVYMLASGVQKLLNRKPEGNI